MKKFLAYFLFTPLFALPIGNALSPSLYDHGLWDFREPYFSWGECTHLRFGYYGDFVANREMEEIISGDPGPNVHQLAIATNAGTLTLDIQNYLDLYILIGSTHISYNGQGMFGDYADFNFSTATAWSFGGSIAIWEYNWFGLGFEGQYFQTKPLLDSYTNLANGQMIYFNELNQMKWREWQGGMTATLVFNFYNALTISPYMGIKASSGKLRQHGFQFLDDSLLYTLNLLETRKLWGYALGLTVVSKGILGATVEGRWANEKAVYANMQLSY